jgi:23S rRNA pseudouridine955/2504/2580 synthase/23S rRNA pseudouridine1911/1915/1917 synthase
LLLMDYTTDLPILYADESLLAVNKPPGLASLPDGYDPTAPHLRGILEPVYGRLWTVHRLDRQTSGVAVLARTAEAHRDLNTQFQQRRVLKVYRALVLGDPPWDEQTVALPLRADGDRRHRTVVDLRLGKPAVTRLRALERFRRFALVEAVPETGRPHQVRVHLREAGAPVACDPLYGDGARIFLSDLPSGVQKERGMDRLLLGRLGLHAWSLTVEHPVAREMLTFQAPYPADLELVLGILRGKPLHLRTAC